MHKKGAKLLFLRIPVAVFRGRVVGASKHAAIVGTVSFERQGPKVRLAYVHFEFVFANVAIFVVFGRLKSPDD